MQLVKIGLFGPRFRPFDGDPVVAERWYAEVGSAYCYLNYPQWFILSPKHRLLHPDAVIADDGGRSLLMPLPA